MVNRYVKKLLSVCIPLSHTLCFLNLPLYATLQQSCSCSERSMSMEFFPTCLTSPLTKYLNKFLGRSARTGSLVCWYIVLCWEWSVGLIHSVYFLIISVVIQLQYPCSVVTTFFVRIVVSQICLQILVLFLFSLVLQLRYLYLVYLTSYQWCRYALFNILVGLWWDLDWDRVRPVYFLGIYVLV